jgi:LuxR family maltose regulon positive regulatory protein
VAKLPAAARIEAALDRVPLVAVVAPAGAGKSTALAAWSATTATRRPVWVRLDPQDDDPYVLARALVTALGTTRSSDPGHTRALLGATATPDVRQLGSALARDLEELDRVVVVFDDLHHLRSDDAQRLVQALIDDAAPPARVLVAGREEPPLQMLSRRARREVIELTVRDLRLDRDQVARLLAEWGIDDARAADIVERSGGWAAAAVLLASRLATSGASRLPVISTLVLGDAEVDQFLRSEVLDPMDPEFRDFVLETSLLDTLDPRGCAAVTGADRPEELLERVAQLALVERVAMAGSSGGSVTLRYHDRIAAFLRAELVSRRTVEQRRALHRRAAAVSGPMRAAELLLEVGELEEASAAVVSVGRALLETPGHHVPRSWLAVFDEAQLAAHPWLGVLAGLAALDSGDVGVATRRLSPVVDIMRSRAERTGFRHAAYGLAEAHLAQGRRAEATALIDELLAQDTSPDERAGVLIGKLWLDYLELDWDGIARGLEEAFTLALRSCGARGRSMVALGLGSEFLFGPAGLEWCTDRATELGRRIEGDILALASLEVMRGAADLIVGNLQRAQEVANGLDERALELGSLNWLVLGADRLRLGVALATGDHHTVVTIVSAARRVLATSGRHRQQRAMYAYALARSGPREGRVDRVRAAQVLLGDVSADDRPDTVVTGAVLDAMRCREMGDLTGAESVLVGLGDLRRRTRFCLLTGLADLELAAIRLELGRRDTAVETARPTLAFLDAVDGMGLLLVDGADTHRPVLEACRADPDVGGFARRALDHLAEPPSATGTVVPETGARLTARELEVLRLVAAGGSNREIGRRLFISERTVKSHMTSLMRKLNVASRTAAVARGRSLGIS